LFSRKEIFIHHPPSPRQHQKQKGIFFVKRKERFKEFFFSQRKTEGGKEKGREEKEKKNIPEKNEKEREKKTKSETKKGESMRTV